MDEPTAELNKVDEKDEIDRKKDRFLPISIVVAAIIIGGSVLFAALYRPGANAPIGRALGRRSRAFVNRTHSPHGAATWFARRYPWKCKCAGDGH